MRRALVLTVLALLMCFAALAETDVRLSEYVIKGAGYKAQLTGHVDAEESIRVMIYNERTLSYEADVTVTPAENVAALNSALLKAPLSSGEKRVTVLADGEEVYSAALYVLGATSNWTGVTPKVKLTVKGDSGVLRDDNIHTTNKIYTDGVRAEFPEDLGAGLLVLTWRHPPISATARFYDRSGNEIGFKTLNSGMYNDCLYFGENVGSVFVDTKDKDGSLADVFVYEADKVPSTLQQWQEIDSKLDILFVSTHQDDELLFFGGAIGYYSYAGKNTAVCYMSDCGIKRYYEAMSGLWVLGLRNRPIFLGYRDVKAGSIAEAQRTWAKQGDPLRDLVELYRKYQPDVVVCQDYNGEYGHYQHRYTAKLVTEAVEAAKDPSKYPESAEKYGTWEVKKHYVHLAKEHAIDIDWDNLEVPGLGGISSIDLDKVAFDRHRSQLADFSIEKQSYKYDAGAFGLVYTAVGYDEIGNDFFENIGG